MKKLISLIALLTIGSAFGMDWVKKAANNASEKLYQAVDTVAGEDTGDQVRAYGQQELNLNGNQTLARRGRGTVRQAKQAWAQHQAEQKENRERARREAEQRRLQEEGSRAVARSRAKRKEINEKYGLGNSQGSSRGTQRSEHDRSNSSSSGAGRFAQGAQQLQLQRVQRQNIEKAKKGMLWSLLGFVGGCVSTVWGARNLLYGSEHFKRDLTVTTAGLGLTGFSGYKFATNFNKFRANR